MSEPSQVVVVGSINHDLVAEVPRLPGAGETVLAVEFHRSVGGKGSNQAVAAARAGAEVSFVGRIGGADPDADRLRAALVDHGVAVDDLLTVDGVESGAAHITTSHGDNVIVVVSGANAEWSTPAPAAALAGATVVIQGEVPMAVNQAVVAAGPHRVICNAAPATDVPDDVLQACDPLVVNEHELAIVAGVEVADASPGATVPAIQALLERGLRSIVVTLGGAGAVLGLPDGTYLHQPTVAAETVDTTGAGDCFVGVLATRLAAGDDLRSAARVACAAASLSVRTRGTHDSYPRPEEIERVLASVPDAQPITA